MKTYEIKLSGEQMGRLLDATYHAEATARILRKDNEESRFIKAEKYFRSIEENAAKIREEIIRQKFQQERSEEE